MKRSPESRRIRRGLDKWLDDVAEDTGRDPHWTAVEVIQGWAGTRRVRKVGLAAMVEASADQLDGPAKSVATDGYSTTLNIGRLTADPAVALINTASSALAKAVGAGRCRLSRRSAW